MVPHPRIILNRARTRPKISVILIDWGVRESFHSLEYLNRQTAARSDYELIWLEFYDREPAGLRRLVAAGGEHGPMLDQWIVLGYPDDTIFHKHRLYNVGLLAARGEVCVICDSDAIFRPTFIERLIRAFAETPDAVVHVDEVRNGHPRFYPFNYPDIAEILGRDCMNWCGTTTRGVVDRADRLHTANYGACMAARRRDLLAVGGADEHLDYLGYVCGPYDLTFRLVNYHGRDERWLRDEYLYHVWHPNQTGINMDYHSPHDGKFMALRALHVRTTFRIKPWLKNPWLGPDWLGRTIGLDRLLELLAARPEPTWKNGAQPAGPPETVYWVERDYAGFNVFAHRGAWYALPDWYNAFNPNKARRGRYRELLEAPDIDRLHTAIHAHMAGHAERARDRGPFRRMLYKVRAQPLHRLPGRVLQKGRRLLAALRPVRSPWDQAIYASRNAT
jgi:hypothetical protein